MQIIKNQLNLDFLSKRSLALGFSGGLILLSVVSFFVMKFNLGIDFTGGTLMELHFEKEADLEKVRSILSEAGYKPSVQRLETPTDILVRLAPQKGKIADLKAKPAEKAATAASEEEGVNPPKKITLGEIVIEKLRQGISDKIVVSREEFVGPQVGAELRDQGGIAVLLALGAILIYVWLRFERRFAIGAILALVHDVIIVLGVFSLFQLQFDLTILAAVLAVIGYSLNDTIVVYDRIRENFRKMRKGAAYDIINRSLNQTLSRTLMTSITTLLVLFALFFLGGDVIRGFAFALIVGIFIGTYSSIYVASITALVLGVSKDDLMPVGKEGEALQNRDY